MGGTEAAEKALQEGEKIEKSLEIAEKDKEKQEKVIHKKRESVHKSSIEEAEKSKEGARKQHVKLKNKLKDDKEKIVKVADKEKVAKTDAADAADKANEESTKFNDAKTVDDEKLTEYNTAKDTEEKAVKDGESATRKIERSEKEIEKAPDQTSYQEATEKKEDAQSSQQEAETKEKAAKADFDEKSKARDETLAEVKDAQTEHENAIAGEASAKAKIESLKTKESEAKSTVTETKQDIDDAKAEEEKHKADIKEVQNKEKVDKDKMAKRIKEIEEEKQKKEGNVKKMIKEKEEKNKEQKVKSAEITSKQVEKQTKADEAEKAIKEVEKKAVWQEQSQKEKKDKEASTKEKKKKADCAAKQEREQMEIRFTLAQDREVELGEGWMNFGNSYEGLRLQKQGNLCMLSGLIRQGEETIPSGIDMGKKFWHAEMESLIQLGEGASTAVAPKGQWGELATMGAQCRPETTIELMANNHAEVSKITIDNEGTVRWKSGGSRHGWISLSGVMWKGGGHTDGTVDSTGIDAIHQSAVTFANGWQGEAVSVYKQGNVCTMLGQTHSGRNFQERIMTLPTFCRPKRKMMFAFSHAQETMRVDVDVDGGVFPYQVPDTVEKYLNLQSIVFPVVDGEDIKLNDDGGWKVVGDQPKPQAFRQGSLCILSGVAFNEDVRSGTHSLLKHSGSPGVLPEWCLPRHRMAFTTISTTGKAQRIDITDDGVIRWIAGAREKYMNLVGIKFDVRADIVQKFSAELLEVQKCEE